MLWEMIKLGIRGGNSTVLYTKEKKLDKEESELEHRIRELDDRLNAGCNSTNMALTFITEKEKLKQNLEILRENKLNGSLIRSKAKIYESMEKPSTLFCNLEKRNYTKKLVNRVNNGSTTITDQTSILTELSNFYKKLYQSRHSGESLTHEQKFFESDLIQKLSEIDAYSCEGKLSLSELSSVLKI